MNVGSGPAPKTEMGIIRNDLTWRDGDGNEIWCNGGGMLRHNGRFFWAGYETAPKRAGKINLYSSDNLADWRFIKTLISRRGAFAGFGWMGRPSLLFNRAAGAYVLLFEASSPAWKRHKVGFARCDTIDGDYELVNCCYAQGERTTGDQSAFAEGDDACLVCTVDKDIDGKKWMNQSLAIFRLTPDYLAVGEKLFEGFDNVNGDPAVIPREHSAREASHIIKVDGVYYWFSSGLVCWESSATFYATARSLGGPWSELRVLRTEPASDDSFNTQHDFVFPVVGREGTVHVYVGDRYSQWTGKGQGRSIFLPIEWAGGEPLLRWRREWRIDVAAGRFHGDAVPQ